MNFLAPPDAVISVAAETCPTLEELERRWRDLESRSDGSFFTSWTWIGTWLSTFADDGALPQVRLVTAQAGTLVVGLALIGECAAPTILNKRTRIAALHQSGVPADDAVFIEYNDFLLDRRFAAPARDAMLGYISAEKDRWREFRLSGVMPAMARAVTHRNLRHRILSDRLCSWIDLAKAPPGLSGYLAILSRNTRQQIQRSLRLYEKEGAVNLTAARDTAEAKSMLENLCVLHQKSWRERKASGSSFVTPRLQRFAARIAEAGVADGSVQVLRASAGAEAFGYLLNFVSRGHVYAYQSGFAYRDDNRFRPGLVTHALAAVRAREQGLRGYHFMAGDGRYKSSLANADEHLLWMTLRHDDLISRAEDAARALKTRLTEVFRRSNA
jgi:CelD/BcsL family acetyltransferase involved in cellulose biosynthesis